MNNFMADPQVNADWKHLAHKFSGGCQAAVELVAQSEYTPYRKPESLFYPVQQTKGNNFMSDSQINAEWKQLAHQVRYGRQVAVQVIAQADVYEPYRKPESPLYPMATHSSFNARYPSMFSAPAPARLPSPSIVYNQVPAIQSQRLPFYRVASGTSGLKTLKRSVLKIHRLQNPSTDIIASSDQVEMNPRQESETPFVSAGSNAQQVAFQPISAAQDEDLTEAHQNHDQGMFEKVNVILAEQLSSPTWDSDVSSDGSSFDDLDEYVFLTPQTSTTGSSEKQQSPRKTKFVEQFSTDVSAGLAGPSPRSDCKLLNLPGMLTFDSQRFQHYSNPIVGHLFVESESKNNTIATKTKCCCWQALKIKIKIKTKNCLRWWRTKR